MRKANQPDKDQIGFRFLDEAEHNRDRAFAGRRVLTAAQKMSLLRGGLEGVMLDEYDKIMILQASNCYELEARLDNMID